MILTDYTFLHIFLGSSVLGITAGILGVFAMARGHSLLGDAISHAAFPGVALMFLCTYSKHPSLLLLGGLLSGVLGAYCVQYIVTNTILKKDAALGIVLSVFFGFGLVLLTVIQKIPTAGQAVLNKFLFGNVAALLTEDLIILAIGSLYIITLLFLFAKELSIIAFDEQYARVQGYNVFLFDLLLMWLLVCTVIIGLQSVGVVLISSLLIAPAAAARQWSYRFYSMLFLSALFGLCGCTLGSYISCTYARIPTGPVIIIILSLFVFVSILLSPYRTSKRAIK